MTGDERRMAAVVAALVAGLSLPGCSFGAAVAQDQAQEQMAPEQKRRLIQVACDLGWPTSKIAQMRQQGIGQFDANKLMKATQMLDQLEEKYQTPFKAVELSSPSVTDAAWRMIAQPTAEPYAGEEVRCRWFKDKPMPTDDFLSRVRAEELRNLMEDIAREVSGRTGISGVCSVGVAKRQLGDEASLSTSVEELSRHLYPWGWFYIAYDPDLDEGDFERCAACFAGELAKRHVGGGFHLRRLLKKTPHEVLTLDDAQELVRMGKDGEDWEYLYMVTAKGWER